ncbi:hypothetical protein M918_20030 [Clostridium sp. BL8]|nr:hypothetical protein M918_20030 [Clostridium sp. BL8]
MLFALSLIIPEEIIPSGSLAPFRIIGCFSRATCPIMPCPLERLILGLSSSVKAKVPFSSNLLCSLSYT